MSDYVHGTRRMYITKRCRCDECKRANTEYLRWYRNGVSRDEYIAALAAAETTTPHGTITRWWRHGCRCELCRVEMTRRHRIWRASKRRVAS